MTEKELISQLKQSSQKAFDEIYRLYSARLYAYCMQYTKSKEDTEEIVQDVFTKLWVYRSTILQEDTLRFFLFKIAKNQLINTYKARVNSFLFEEYVYFYNEERLSVNDTHYAVEYDDFCLIIKNAMRHLTESQREVVVSCKLEQLSNKETAEKLLLKEQTVKNLLSTGLKALREELKRNLTWILILLIVKL